MVQQVAVVAAVTMESEVPVAATEQIHFAAEIRSHPYQSAAAAGQVGAWS